MTLLTGLFFISSCKVVDKTQKEYEKKEKLADKEAEKAYKLELKKHEKLQSKSTQKMMRQTRKRAKKYNKSKRT